ncbi:MAG: biliverdin-producing heme oxygenase [Planctomycetota bacterium]|nr:biliverdin-producing heme oxygenase [Planctomycetota bacterium]
MTTTSAGLADRLKLETREMHTAAERHPLHAALFKGERPLAEFARLHAQTALVQRAVEARVGSSPLLRPMRRDYHTRAEAMLRDAAAFGVGPHPADATRRMIDEIDRADEATLLGLWYVLEGATNGGRFIAVALTRAHGAFTMPSLHPHGEQQGERWGAFRAGLESLALTAPQQDAVVAGAARMFRHMVELMDELAGAPAASA